MERPPLNRPIQSVVLGYLVHATEDQAKILKAVEGVIGQSVGPDLERLEGHFGNEILKVTIRLTGEAALTAFGAILSKMGPRLTREIAADSAPFLDEHSAMFLRFDKQALLGGSLVLGSADPVRVKIKPRGFLLRGGAPAFFRELFQGA